MKVHDVSQGSLEWLQLRAGVPTASEFDSLVSPTWEIRKGDMPRTYLHKKLAEWWQRIQARPAFKQAFAVKNPDTTDPMQR